MGLTCLLMIYWGIYPNNFQAIPMNKSMCQAYEKAFEQKGHYTAECVCVEFKP